MSDSRVYPAARARCDMCGHSLARCRAGKQRIAESFQLDKVDGHGAAEVRIFPLARDPHEGLVGMKSIRPEYIGSVTMNVLGCMRVEESMSDRAFHRAK